MVFDVRPGNPKNIQTWDDLIRDDVAVITPNPITSGGAQWNILAAYQAQIDAGKTEEEAIEYLNKLAARVAVWDRGARDALNTFLRRARVTCSSATRTRRSSPSRPGQPLEYIVPDNTLLIENAIATTLDRGRARRRPRRSSTSCTRPRRRRVFGNHGFRPEVRGGRGAVPGLRTARPTWPRSMVTWAAGPRRGPSSSIPETGIMAEIFRDLGIED